jgi:hypothetical protein
MYFSNPTSYFHLVVRNILPEVVVIPLIELSRFFNAICSKELEENDIVKLTTCIRETLCRLEMIFPLAYFDIMMHLPVHIAEEAKVGGHVCYRWMYPIERYLRTLKGYVQNKGHLECSIAEGYISKECMTFCSPVLQDIDTKLTCLEHHESASMNEPPLGPSLFGNTDNCKKGGSMQDVCGEDMQRMCDRTTLKMRGLSSRIRIR